VLHRPVEVAAQSRLTPVIIERPLSSIDWQCCYFEKIKKLKYLKTFSIVKLDHLGNLNGGWFWDRIGVLPFFPGIWVFISKP